MACRDRSRPVVVPVAWCCGIINHEENRMTADHFEDTVTTLIERIPFQMFKLKFPPSIELYLARKCNNNREYLSNWQKQKRERVGM